jgi:hypothetical protein
VNLDVAPVWLLLPGSEDIYTTKKFSLFLEKKTPGLLEPVETTAVEFRNRFGTSIGLFPS